MDFTGFRPRILIIDSYDSFTNNLAALVSTVVPHAIIHIIRNDQLPFKALLQYVRCFTAILVGPGPGSPLIPSDIGVIQDLWHVDNSTLVPIFGVCLGLQSLAVEFGAKLKRLNVVKHGQVSTIQHVRGELFQDIPSSCNVVRYHSLHVDISQCTALRELAWTDDGDENGTVVMAIGHTVKPFWAVQYHPESICTDGSGPAVISNFMHLALQWWKTTKARLSPWNSIADAIFPCPWPDQSIPPRPDTYDAPSQVFTRTLTLPSLTVPQVCEIVGVYKTNTDFVLLDSAAQPGRFSIIGCIDSSTLKLTHYIGDSYVTITKGTTDTLHPLDRDIWAWLESFMRTRRAVGGDKDLPFWGGLVGYISYELGVDTMKVKLLQRGSASRLPRFPDVSMAFVDRSIVMEPKTGRLHLQSLCPLDDDWFDQTVTKLLRAAHLQATNSEVEEEPKVSSDRDCRVFLPDSDDYMAKVRKCQEFLLSGDTYELCYTARTHVKVPRQVTSSQSSWNLYKSLRSVNPAPYAAFLRLHPTTLLSSSPERFLNYSRPPHQRFQLRPIKGTVRKGGGMTRERAETILSTPKEIGENLMIVDLIRHDLYGAIGNNVEVKKFCGIEEYETVWQLVSVIEGDYTTHLPEGVGYEVLKNSLPPGSMTGAPKKRSVEILQELEDSERTVYSGVAGYWCSSGSGDWSVVIRSCFKYDDSLDNTSGQIPRGSNNGQDEEEGIEDPSNCCDHWIIGSGGAITALSDSRDEWEEMLVKLQSVLRAFPKDS